MCLVWPGTCRDADKFFLAVRPVLTFDLCSPPLQHGSKVLVFFYGMFNIYVLFLAFLYTPVGMAYRDLNSPSNVRHSLVHDISRRPVMSAV